MASLDRVQSDLNFYIGGLFNLRRKEALKNANITHVLSVLKLPLDEKLFENYAHKVVEVDDVDDENLLEHFESCNKFIQDGLDAGGGVLVHCAAGKSRSSTVACAYLMQRYGITADEALKRIRESRPFCEPNEGFWKQLELYFQMGTPDEMESVPAYQRWVYLQEVALSRACGQAPEADKIRFEDEHEQSSANADYDMRCRKCRRTLATSQYLVNHQATQVAASTNPKNTSSTCSHYFLDPLSWMRPELEQGKLDGRLECPKCKSNVGKYAWQGMQCNCGDWILPAISLSKSKIDEVKSRPQGDAAGFGIRVPPPSVSGVGRKPGVGQGNL